MRRVLWVLLLAGCTAAEATEADYPIALVTWDDAYHITGYAEEMPEIQVMQTVGFVLRDDEAGVVLAMEIHDEGDRWRDVTIIPRGMVRKVKVLRR